MCVTVLSSSYLVVELNIHVLPKTTAIVITIGLGITKRLRIKMIILLRQEWSWSPLGQDLIAAVDPSLCQPHPCGRYTEQDTAVSSCLPL